MDAILKGFVFALGLLTGLLGGRFAYLRLEGKAALTRWSAAAVPGLAVLMAGYWVPILLETPYFSWNAIRLAPSFALLHGYSLYYGPEDGPVSGHIYGPVPVFCYLPAALAGTPSLAVMIGSVIASTFYFLPAAWLLVLQRRRERLSWVAGLAGGLALFGFTIFSEPLRYVAFNVHVDAIALGFAACAFALLPTNPREAHWRQFCGTALCVALSLWSKQTMVPLLLTVPLGLGLTHGLRPMLRLSAMMAGAFGGLSVLLLATFGFHNVWFNMWVLPSHHPWQASLATETKGVILGRSFSARLRVLWEAFLNLGPFLLRPVGWLAAAFLICRRWGRPSATNEDRLRMDFWLVLTGGVMIVISCIGRVKLGGDVNVYSYSMYFLAIAAALGVARVTHLLASQLPELHNARALKLACWIGVAGFSVLWWRDMSSIDGALRLPTAPNDEASEIMQASEGNIYFPWYPLAHLCAEGKLYHQPYGLFDRTIGGYSVTRQHLYDNMPKDIKMIAFMVKDEMIIMTNALPEFNQKQITTNYPAWIFFAKPQPHTR